MKKKFFLVTAVLLAVFLSGCNQNIETTKNVKNPPAPPADTKHKVTVTQPANGKIEVTPALPADSMVTNGSELTFTLSANKGYKVKTLTIGGTAYSDVTDNRITKKIKIEKDTEVSAVLETETKPEDPNNPKPEEPATDKTDVPDTTTEIKDDEETEEDKNAIGEHRGTIKVVKITQNGKSEEQVEITGNILSKKTEDVLKLLKDEKYKDKKISKDSNLNIKFTQKSSTIDKSKLNELAKIMPNPIKIDDEKTVKLDKNANIISIKGNINLSDLTKGKTTENEINFVEFISDKIASTEGKKIATESLTIKSSEKEKFSKENLKKVANALSKTNITNTTLNGNQNITLDNNANISSISGNISLKDITEANNEPKTKLANYIAYNLKTNSDKNFQSNDLKINTFYKTLKTAQGSSLNVMDSNTSNQDNVEYEHFTITPDTLKILKDMENNALNNAKLNYKNEKSETISISFKGDFDISKFAKEMDNNKKLKEILNFPANAITGKLHLNAKRDKEEDGNYDITPYPNVKNLLKIINNEALSGKIKVKEIKLRGNVRDLLPHLLPGNKIEEKYGNITIPGFMETDCKDPHWTGYNGQEPGEEKRSTLPGDQFLELTKRTNEGQTYIRNAIIQGLNLEEELIVKQANWANTTFKNCNLSKMSILGMDAALSNLEFKDTTLPYNMNGLLVGELKLHDITFPKEKILEETKKTPVKILHLNSMTPQIRTKLTISGYVKDSPLNALTEEELKDLERLKPNTLPNMPKSYEGLEDIYNNLKKYLYNGESKFINGKENKNYPGNTTGSLNKPLHRSQDQLLAILKKRKERSHG